FLPDFKSSTSITLKSLSYFFAIIQIYYLWTLLIRLNKCRHSRSLVLFGEYEPDDNILDILPALRNGLLHNVSLVSKSKYPNQSNYIFRYSNEEDNLNDVYQNSSRVWDGNFGTLSSNGREHYTTLINTDKLNDLLNKCLRNAEELNNKSLLKIKLDGGKEEFGVSTFVETN
ncbi:hypothetical protein, partial [Tenacibaculum maritimum]|uniref:hypothetical protein n=1 Tax=Tenacibaculum maritimum TaxID=107401 RepID=UPI001330F376